MKPHSNPALEKKFNEIEATHIAKSELLPGICPIWYPELKVMDIPPPSWRVDRLITVGGITAISSQPGMFKTWFAFEVAVRVSRGEPLFDRYETKQCKVLILDEESGLGRIRYRLSALAADNSEIATLADNHFKMSPLLAEAIIKYCKDNEIGLVIFDSMRKFHNEDENSSQKMSIVLEDFKRIAQAGISVFIIHHDTKGADSTMRGSGDILAVCDVQISLRYKDKSNPNIVVVHQNKNRDAELLPDFELYAKSNEDKTRLWFEYVGETPPRKSKQTLADEAILELLTVNVRMFQDEIVKALKGAVGAKTVTKQLKVLHKDRILNLNIGENGKNYYELNTEQSNG